MNSWRLPLDLECLGPTSDSMSFQNIDITKQYHIPVMASDEIGEQHHVGAFGCTRKHNRHSGVDLYCPEGTPVYAVEYGTILKIDHWTGPKDNTPWWLDTDAVYVQGQYGVVVYGEIEVNKDLHVGDLIHPSDLIGKVKRVLRKDKGRRVSMLHLQMYVHHKTSAGAWKWEMGEAQPEHLLDPTDYLVDSYLQSIGIYNWKEGNDDD